MQEEWRTVKGYEGLYEVSNHGNVRSLKFGKIIELTKSLSGYKGDRQYLAVHLRIHGKSKTAKVHRLVATGFIPNMHNKPCIHHIDNNPMNNMVDNLNWCTQKENISHAARIGRMCGGGNKHGGYPHKITLSTRAEIKNLYLRGDITYKEIAARYNVSKSAIQWVVGL